MKICLLALVLLLGTSRAFAQLLPAAEAAIRRVVQRITANYTDHHFADMATYTTPDVSWVNIVGMWGRSRSVVQQAHQQIFAAILRGVAFTPAKATARGIAPGVAVANLYCHVGAFYPPDGIDHGTNEEGDAYALLTLVLVKKQGTWLRAAGQNTVVRASAQTNNPIGQPRPAPFGPTKAAGMH